MRRSWWQIGLCVAALLAVRPSAAETIAVTVDKGTLLRLPQNADVVLVAEPGIANAVIESPRMIFILGKRPGETNLFVMDRAGNTILKVDVVVSPNDPREVTVYRGGSQSTLGCYPRCQGSPAQPARPNS